MHTRLLVPMALLVLVPNWVLSAPAACVAPGLPTARPQQALFQALNAYRAGLGLPGLRYSKALELAALEHARDMERRNYFDHADPEGRRVPDRVETTGFCHRKVGENLVWGRNSVRTADAAMKRWKESPGHDANLRHPKYRYVGLALHRKRKADGVHYFWVQVFGFDVGP